MVREGVVGLGRNLAFGDAEVQVTLTEMTGKMKGFGSLPPRMVSEPMPEGPAKGMVCHLDEMLDEYYRLRGWDQNGIPGPAKLKGLGLDDNRKTPPCASM